MSKCPHCGAVAHVEPSASLRWRCAVCGGPLVPTEGDIARSDGELPHLVRSHRARAMALGWLAAFLVLGSIAAMAVGVALLVWFASHVAAAVLGVVALVASTLAVASLRRSRRQRAEAREQLDHAWDRVAGEVLGSRRGDTTAADLARIMSTKEEHAEGLLSRLSAHGGARVDVRDDAELAYRVSDEGAVGGADDAESPGAAGRRLRAR
jgi:Flp pilus assembly protein TadB